MINQQSLKEKALRMFQTYQRTENTLLKRQEFKKILDQQTKKQLQQQNHFDEELFQELWEQCQANTKGEVTVGIFVAVINDAYAILNKRLDTLNKPGGLLQQQTEKVNIINQDLQEMTKISPFDHDDVTQINKLRKELTLAQRTLNQLQIDEKNFKKEKKIIESTFYPIQIEQIIPHILHILPQPQKQSKKLLIMFHITNVCLFLEFFISIYRLSFLSLLICLQMYYFLFFGYYLDKSMLLLLIQLIASIVLDLGYLVINWFGIVKPIDHSSNYPLYIICLILLVVQIILRGILTGLSYPYKTINEQTQYYKIWQTKIYINKKKYRKFFDL